LTVDQELNEALMEEQDKVKLAVLCAASSCARV